MKTGNSAPLAFPAEVRAVTWRSGGHNRHVVFGVVDGQPSSRVLQPGFVAQNFGVNFVLQGAARFRDWLGQEHQLATGNVVARRPGLPTTLLLDPTKPWREWYFTIDPTTFAELESSGLLQPRPLLSPALPAGLVQTWRDLRLSLDSAHPPPPAELLLSAVRLVQAATSHSKASVAATLDTRLAHAARLLETNFASPLDLATVADTVGLGHETLRKSFRARFGVSPGRYRILKRIEMAKALLAQDTLQIQEIAALLGYSDPFAFSAQFRAHVGHSPRAHRAR